MQQKIATFTGLLVVVGFLQAAVLVLQWLLVRRQDAHFRNSERAWIMAELGWYEKTLHVTEGTYNVEGESGTSTNVNVKLTCKNEGRSPAWIEHIKGGVEITSAAALKKAPIPEVKALESFGRLDPLGAGAAASCSLQMECQGHRDKDEFLSVYVHIQYRDIFGIMRETTLGYSIDRNGGIYRQYAHPERNRNI